MLDLHVWHPVSTAKWTSCLHARYIGNWQLSCPAVLRLFYRSQRLDAETLGIFLDQLIYVDNLRTGPDSIDERMKGRRQHFIQEDVH